MKKMKRSIRRARYGYAMIIVLFTLTSFAQNNHKVQCVDMDTNTPIENVTIQDSRSHLGFTNNNGESEFNTKQTMIICTHLSYVDTIIYLQNEKPQIIKLQRQSNLLKESKVSSKYDQHAHLKRLIKKNKRLSDQVDSTLYYYFEISYTVEETNDSSFISGVMKLPFTGFDDIFSLRNFRMNIKSGESKCRERLVRLDEYYNTNEDSSIRHRLFPSNLYSLDPGFNTYNRYFKQYCRLNNLNKFPIHQNDTTIINLKNDKVTFDISFLSKNEMIYEVSKNYKRKHDSLDLKVDFSHYILSPRIGMTTEFFKHIEYNFIHSNGNTYHIKATSKFTLMDSLPKHNTDVPFSWFTAHPINIYNNYKIFSNKNYVPDLDLPEVPDYVKDIYLKEEEQ